MRAQFGSFEWGDPKDGKLSTGEKLKCIRTMAFLVAREATDVGRSALGLLRPVDGRLADLAPPDSRLVKETEQHVVETHSKTLLFHCYRTYYFGRLLSAYDRIKCNRPADGVVTRRQASSRAAAHAPGSSSSMALVGWSCTRASTSARYSKGLMRRASHVATNE
jgi:hypothetical protein